MISGAAIKSGIKAGGMILKKYLPSILIGVGVTGMISATVVAVKATPEAYEALKEQQEDEERIAEMMDREPRKDIWARTKIIAKHYWPTATIIIISGGCILVANSIHLKREIALAAAYHLSQKNLDELKDKIVEVDGKKKLQKLNEAIVNDELKKNNGEDEKNAFVVGDGTHRCKIRGTGVVFYSTIDKVNRAEIELDKLLLSNNYASLDNYYDFLEVPEDKRGLWDDDLGWKCFSPDDLPTFEYISALDGGVPTYVVCIDLEPKHDYWKDSQ